VFVVTSSSTGVLTTKSIFKSQFFFYFRRETVATWQPKDKLLIRQSQSEVIWLHGVVLTTSAISISHVDIHVYSRVRSEERSCSRS